MDAAIMDGKRLSLRLKDGIEITPFDTSTVAPRYLVRLPGGGRFQVSARLADVIRALMKDSRPEAACARLRKAWGRKVSPNDLEAIAARFLRPYGLLADGITVKGEVAQRQPLLVHLPLFSARSLAPLTSVGQGLFAPSLVCAILLINLGIRYALYLQAPSPSGASQVGGAMWLPVLLLLSILCHELGHVSACRRYGCAHGAIGVGIYAIMPVFYSDVTDSWRLPRRQRMAVDLAGVYFQLIFSMVVYGLAVLLHWQTAWVALKVTDGMMLLALNPILRFDGYWLFSDLIGVPNLHQRASDTIRWAVRWLFRNERGPRPDLLRLPAAEMALLVGYTLISNALLIYVFGNLLLRYAPAMAISFPRLLVQSWTLLQAGIAQRDATLIVSALKQPLAATLLLGMVILMAWRGRHWVAHSVNGLRSWAGVRNTKIRPEM